ncbi:hypothetical protein V6N13_019872 [Hibiscus sabdariffa]
MGGLPSYTEVAKKATHEHCKAITTRSGKQLKEVQTTNQGDKALTEPSAAATPKNITLAGNDDINHEDPDDTIAVEVRVEHETDRDASATDVASTPQISDQNNYLSGNHLYNQTIDPEKDAETNSKRQKEGPSDVVPKIQHEQKLTTILLKETRKGKL